MTSAILRLPFFFLRRLELQPEPKDPGFDVIAALFLDPYMYGKTLIVLVLVAVFVFALYLHLLPGLGIKSSSSSCNRGIWHHQPRFRLKLCVFIHFLFWKKQYKK